MSIATKTGDKGETSLMYGRRVPKTDHRVDAYGCVDELNSALGLARAAVSNEFVRSEILAAQKELITVMGELATSPEDLERYRKDGFQITADAMVDRLTAVIDELEKDESLYPKDWVIPGLRSLRPRSIMRALPAAAPSVASPPWSTTTRTSTSRSCVTSIACPICAGCWPERSNRRTRS